MPRSESDDRELTDEELETVVGGSKNMKHLFENWRNHTQEKIKDVLPHAEIKSMEKIGSSVLLNTIGLKPGDSTLTKSNQLFA